MRLQGQRTRSTRRSHARPGSPGKPGTGERGLDIPGTERTGGRAIGSQNQRHEVCAKMRQAAGVGPPDVVKATCPVRGALGGNPLSRGSTDAVLRLHSGRYNLRRLRKRDYSRSLASELDVKVSLHPAQAWNNAPGCACGASLTGRGFDTVKPLA